MESCEGCQVWRLWFKGPGHTLRNDKELTCIHETAKSFLEAVKTGCRLCTYMRASLLKDVSDEELRSQNDLPASRLGFVTYRIIDEREHGEEGFSLHIVIVLRSSTERHFLVARFELGPVAQTSPSHAIPPRPARSEKLKFLKDHLSDCEDCHDECRVKASSHYLPTRILYVGTEDAPQLRLQLKTDQEAEFSDVPKQYITLSHRWGDNVNFKLTLNNLAQFRGGFSETSLPKTFQDAIYVARHFGIQFLWIDALCIIQDDEADWQHESAQMSQIYQKCYFNIAAGYATDGSGGLFAQSCGFDPGIVVAKWQPQDELQSHVLCHTGFIEDVIFKEPLYQRGWVVQEQFLSPRILHFTTHQVAWECADSFVCQSYPQGLPKSMQPDYTLGCGGKSFYQTDDLLGRQKWRNVIQRYSSCSLTYSSDKLVAIRGLVAFFQQVYNQGEFLDGLWVSDLPGELLWTVARPGLKLPSCEYRAPSWSWASIDGEIQFTPTTKDEMHLIEIEGFSGMSSSDSLISQVKHAWIDIHGSLLELRVQYTVGLAFKAYLAQWPSFQALEKDIQTSVNELAQIARDSAETTSYSTDYPAIMSGLSDAAADIDVNLDTSELFNHFKEATVAAPASAWFLPIKLNGNGFASGLVIREIEGTCGTNFSRIGEAELWCRGSNGEKFVRDLAEVVESIMAKFLTGKLRFQQSQPEIFGKQKIRLY